MSEKYINPYTDFGFKKLFGTLASKALLKDFLNTLLPSRHQIADLQFKNTEQLGQTEADRKAIYDVYCESVTGERFIVELQRIKQANFKERTIYYATFPVVEQAQKGGEWDYNLKAVYCVSILDFTFETGEQNTGKVAHFIQLKDQNNQVFYDKLNFIYLEMPNFTLQEHELTTQRDKWLFFIKNLKNLQVIPMILQNNEIFEQAFKTAELANMSRDEWLSYEYSLKAYRDNRATERYQLEEGRRQGLEEGRTKGLAEGRAEGREQGIIEGRNVGKLEGLKEGLKEGIMQTAKSLKLLNLPITTIVEATGLSIEEIEKL